MSIDPRKAPFLSYLSLLLVVCLLTAGAAFIAAQHRFGAYDLSPLIDSGWRVLQGQIPNHDFICTFPPLSYLSVAVAFWAFGVRWTAVSLVGVLFPLLLTSGGLRVVVLLRAQIGEPSARWICFIYASLQMALMLPLTYPWHSSWTEAVVLYACLVTFSVAVCGRTRIHTKELLLYTAIAWSLLLIGKPNSAFPTLLFSSLALTFCCRRFEVLIAGCSAVALASLALLPVRTSLFRTFQVYMLLRSRFWTSSFIVNKDIGSGRQTLLVYAISFPILIWVLAQVLSPLTSFPAWLRLLVLGAVSSSIAGLVLNAELSLVDVSPLIMSAALILSISARASERARLTLNIATVSMLLVAVSYCALRTRMRTIGLWADGSCQTVEESDPFFGSFHSCPAQFSVMREIGEVLRTVPKSSVFFGPRLEFEYAREDVTSPRGLPLWWDPGASYPLSDTSRVIAAFEADRFQTLIFLRGDRTRMPRELLKQIGRDYVLVPHPTPATANDPRAQIEVYARH